MRQETTCNQQHAGPCKFVTTGQWERLPMLGFPGRSRQDLSVVDGQRFDRWQLPLGRIPGVYLLGDYYVGRSQDIGQRVAWHTNVVTYQVGTALHRAYRDYTDRHHGCMPRVTVLSLHELDEMYCIQGMIDSGFNLVNLDVRPQILRTCIADEAPNRKDYLRNLLERVNRLQVVPTICG